MRKKKRYTDFENPYEFLQNVFNTWTIFCEVNCGLANAISDLLRENERLRLEVQRLKKAAIPKDSD